MCIYWLQNELIVESMPGLCVEQYLVFFRGTGLPHNFLLTKLQAVQSY